MTARNVFAARKRAALDQLVAAVPPLDAHRGHDATRAIVTIVAATALEMTATLRDHRLDARLLVSALPRADRFAEALIEQIRRAIDQRATEVQPPSFDPGGWLDDAGLIELLAELATAGAGERELAVLTESVGAAIKALSERIEQLAKDHLAAVLRRDLPWFRSPVGNLTPRLAWLLALDHAGDGRRALLVDQRSQAIAIYGSIDSVLREPAITAVIDRAEPLAPALCDRLGIVAAQLRRLRDARARVTTMAAFEDYTRAVIELTAHAVPLGDWPQGEDWATSQWVKRRERALFRPDLIGEGVEARDALTALREDLLEPLAFARAQALELEPRHELSSFLRGFSVPETLAAHPARRQLLVALSAAVIGPRGASGFAEAVGRWHRRAACAAAIRHEHAADRPGWPGLCAPWSTPDGQYAIVPLVTASELVEEGNALDHCVGGYYSQCRTGDTQILSLRDGSARVATIELHVADRSGGGLTLGMGQFKAQRNRRPADAHHRVLRAFVTDLENGRHPIARAALTAYRKERRDQGDYVWHRTALPPAHAERAWPLYAALLPKQRPATLQAWADASGLTAAFDAMLRALADPANSISMRRVAP